MRAFIDALHRVAAGGTVLDRQVVTQLLAPRDEAPRTPCRGLTAREREVLELMAEGRSNSAIAESLVVTPGAVEKHITNIFAKLDLPACDDDHRRVLAVLAYLRVARSERRRRRAAGPGRTPGRTMGKRLMKVIGAGPPAHRHDHPDVRAGTARTRALLPHARPAGRPREGPAAVGSGRGGQPDWERIFGEAASTVDWPSARFYRELMDYYPDAKVLLSVRGRRGMGRAACGRPCGGSSTATRSLHHLCEARAALDPLWRRYMALMRWMSWDERSGALAGDTSTDEGLAAAMERWNETRHADRAGRAPARVEPERRLGAAVRVPRGRRCRRSRCRA